MTTLVTEYNTLVAEAVALGLNYKPVQRFSDNATGQKRLEALQSSIRAKQSGEAQADRQEEKPESQNGQEEKPEGENGQEKAKEPVKAPARARAPKKAKTAKGAAPRAKAKPSKAKAPPAEPLSPLCAKFGSRPGSNQEKLIALLEAGKVVQEEDLLAGIYGSKKETNRGAFRMVLAGVRAVIEKESLPYEVICHRAGKDGGSKYELARKK